MVNARINEETEGLSEELWSKKLGICPRKIFEFLLENRYEEFSKEEIAENTEYSPNTGGFSNAISKLNALGIIQRNNGSIKLNPEILEL